MPSINMPAFVDVRVEKVSFNTTAHWQDDRWRVYAAGPSKDVVQELDQAMIDKDAGNTYFKGQWNGYRWEIQRPLTAAETGAVGFVAF